MKILPVGTERFPRGQKNRHEEANSRVSKFRERA
jgi:hypothetical protein